MRIEIALSDVQLWGNTDPAEEGLDKKESFVTFSEILDGYLCEEYPGADVEIVNQDYEYARIDGQDDHDERANIELLIDKAWHGDWQEFA